MEDIENLPVVRKARKEYHDKLRMLYEVQKQVKKNIAEYSYKYMMQLQRQVNNAELKYIRVREAEKAKREAYNRPVVRKGVQTVEPLKHMSKQQAKDFLKNKRGTRICKDQCCVCGQYFSSGWMYHSGSQVLVICNGCKSRCMNGKMNFSRQAIDCKF